MMMDLFAAAISLAMVTILKLANAKGSFILDVGVMPIDLIHLKRVINVVKKMNAKQNHCIHACYRGMRVMLMPLKIGIFMIVKYANVGEPVEVNVKVERLSPHQSCVKSHAKI
jgi:hypothetical protein